MKRTSMLCLLALLAVLITALPAFSVSEMYPAYNTDGSGVRTVIPFCSGTLPLYIDFVLNSKSDVKVEIMPSNSAGVLTGDPSIRTQTFLNQPKGRWLPASGGSYAWDGLDDFGNPAQNGYYVARVTATNVGTNKYNGGSYGTPTYQLDAFPMFPTEAVPDPGPGYWGAFQTHPALDQAGYRDATNGVSFNTTGSACWIGVAINKNKTSPYYGWMFAGQTIGAVGVKAVSIYGPDGTYMGRLPDPSVNPYSGTSNPYGVVIADDGYIYVWDRGSSRIHCFSMGAYSDGGTPGTTPAQRADDVYGTWLSVSPTINNFTGGNAANYDAATGRTFVYGQSSGNPPSFLSKTFQIMLESNHTTWGTGGSSAINFVRDPEGVYSNGLVVSANNLTCYLTSSYQYTTGTTLSAWQGIRRKTRTSTGSTVTDGVYPAAAKFTFPTGDTWGITGARSIYTGGALVKEDWEQLTFTGLLAAWQATAGPPPTYYTWKLSIGAFSTPDLPYQISSADLKTALNNLLIAAGETARVVDCDFTGNGTSTVYVRRWTYGVPPSTAPVITYSDTRPGGSATFATGNKQIVAHDGSYVGSDISTRVCSDVALSADGTFLWVTTGQDTATPNVFKVDVATGNIIELGKSTPTMGSRRTNSIYPDAVGNFALMWGGTSGTPAIQMLWLAMMDWGVKTDTVRLSTQRYTGDTGAPLTSGVVQVTGDAPPTLVPGSVQWTVNPLWPDGATTTDVSFKVVDGNGWTDIASVVLDLKELMATGGTTTQTATIAQDMDDPTGRKAIVTLGNITAVAGTRPGVRSINVSFIDVHDVPGTPKRSSSVFQLTIPANQLAATVKHTRSGMNVAGAVVTAIGGVAGVWGYPNTYTVTADNTGLANISLGQGEYVLKAALIGYKTQTDQAFTSGGYPAADNAEVLLGPLNVTEARALGNAYSSVEGVVYAQPQGGMHAGAFVAGMGPRVFSAPLVNVNLENQSLYIVDPTDSAKMGLMVQLAKTRYNYGGTASPIYRTKQWDDPAETNTATGNSTFIGKRPANGEAICVSGPLNQGSGSAYEMAIEIDAAALETSGAGGYSQWYMNLTDKGFTPLNTSITPVTVTVPNIIRSTVDYSQYGKYAKVNNVKVLEWRPNSNKLFADGTTSTDPVDYVIVQDNLGATAPIAFTTLASYGLTAGVCPVTIGATYNFTGAIGKLMKFDQGTIRVMGTPGIEKTADPLPLPGANSVGSIRGQSTGDTAAIRGIVTSATATDIYVESADRSAAVQVKVTAPASIANILQGYEVAVHGTITADALTGVRYIASTPQKIERVGTVTHALTELDLGMRTMDVGGKNCGNDKGITNGRGALNMGLYVTVQGTVTYRDSTANTGNFYIWDGGNMVLPGQIPAPLADGSGNRGLRIVHNGYLTDPVGHGVVPWVDFVTVKGIVSAIKIGANVVPQIIPMSIRWNNNALNAGAGDFVTITDGGTVGNGGVALRPFNGATGYNEISIPAVPARAGTGLVPDPSAYTDDPNPMPWDPMVVFAPNDPMYGFQNSFFRVENTRGNQFTYDDVGWKSFGGMMLGGGYQVLQLEPWTTISYKGIKNTIPQWLAVDDPGLFYIGCPRDTSVPTANILISDGGQVKTLRNATWWGDDAGTGDWWLDAVGYGWENVNQNQITVSPEPEELPSSAVIQPWHSYAFNMLQGTKAWIIP